MIDWNNEKIILAAVSNCGWNLDWYNEEQVIKAVLNNGYALKYASRELQNNEKIVLAAVSNHGISFQFTSSRLKNSRSFCSLIFNRNFNTNEIRTNRKSKLYDFKFRFNKIQIQNFKDILMKIF